MRFFVAVFFLVLLVFVGLQAYRLYGQKAELENREIELRAQAAAMLAENKKFADDIQYLKNDINAAKELQSKFNYRKPDEKMFMLVPTKQ